MRDYILACWTQGGSVTSLKNQTMLIKTQVRSAKVNLHLSISFPPPSSMEFASDISVLKPEIKKSVFFSSMSLACFPSTSVHAKFVIPDFSSLLWLLVLPKHHGLILFWIFLQVSSPTFKITLSKTSNSLTDGNLAKLGLGSNNILLYEDLRRHLRNRVHIGNWV